MDSLLREDELPGGNKPDRLVGDEPAAKRYRTIVIDPPWPGPGKAWRPTGRDHESVIPYATMTGIQCAALRVGALAADDAQLFIWSPSRNLGDAYLLLQTWDFPYRGLFAWKKPLGLGLAVRHELEFLVWGARPGARRPRPRKVPRQVHEWPRGRHSVKPAEAYELIASLSPAPRIDLFARQRRPGFDGWGNQLEGVTPICKETAA